MGILTHKLTKSHNYTNKRHTYEWKAATAWGSSAGPILVLM